MAETEDIQNAEEQIALLRDELSALRSELEQTNRNSRQYLQNVAHQLTAPLGAIKWSIEALQDKEVAFPRKLKLFSSIYSQATILVHLIKNFSLMSNLEADLELGEFREKPERIDVLRLSINLANDFQPQGAEGYKKIVVNDDSFPVALGGNNILGVKNLLAQALSNLLENAVKYADLRTVIKVEGVRVVPVPNTPPLFGISVTSIGLPILPQEVSKLLQRGFRGKAAQQKIPAGTGIGLYLANRIAELHGGTILVKAVGKESSFILTLPETRIV